jgi:hypothetical protein
MNPDEPLTKDRLVRILARDGLSNYNRIVLDAAKLENGGGVLAVLNNEIGPARNKAGDVLVRHGINDPAAAASLALEGIALQVASMAPPPGSPPALRRPAGPVV